MKTIGLRTLVEELNLKNLTPDVDMDDVRIATPDINRPALQLTGYYEHLPMSGCKIIGYVELFLICSTSKKRCVSKCLRILCPAKFHVSFLQPTCSRDRRS